MGLNMFARSSDRGGKTVYVNNTEVVYKRHPNDPNPALFTIRHIEQHGDFVVALVHYPNCTNYEGEKIIVWKGQTVAKIKDKLMIDPHFLNDDQTLVARFIPTTQGWAMAQKFVRSFDK